MNSNNQATVLNLDDLQLTDLRVEELRSDAVGTLSQTTAAANAFSGTGRLTVNCATGSGSSVWLPTSV